MRFFRWNNTELVKVVREKMSLQKRLNLQLDIDAYKDDLISTQKLLLDSKDEAIDYLNAVIMELKNQ